MPPKPKFTRDEIVQAAMRRFESYAEQKLPGMLLFKQIGMQMVLFGAKAPTLYQLLFMQENRCAVSFDDVFGELGPTARTCIGLIRETYGLRAAEAQLLFENMWIYTFGVGALCARGSAGFPRKSSGRCCPSSFRQ